MTTELIRPNLHVVLVHYPMALLITGVLIEWFSFLWRRSSFRTAGRWMILLGTLSAIPATFSGIYALRDVSRIPIDSDMHWAEIRSTSPVFTQPHVWHMLREHVLYQSLATGAAALVVVIWLGSSDRLRAKLHWLLMLVLIVTVGIMIRAAWFAGEAIYQKGVAVEAVFPLPATQPADTAAPATQPASWKNTPTTLERMFPPLELHTIMAGVFTAIAVVAIGLSFRKINAIYHAPDELPMVTGDPSAVLSAALKKPPTPASSVTMVRTFNPDLELEVRPFAPAGRFWLLAFLLGLLTFTGGLFVIARGADLFEPMSNQPKQIPNLLWEQIKPPHGQKIDRLFAHAATGAAIIILPIVLGLLSRFAPRERIILLLTTLLLLAAVGVQIWLGVLLMFDSPDGPATAFNPPAAAVNSP
jgi:uncharacterized membrane protein